jgi:hypothetical protein
MSTVVHGGDMTTTRVREREAMTAAEVEALAERTAQELLGISWPDALAALDRGEFAGQGVEPTLRGIKRLIDS